jgi:hypothetical protein
VEVATQVLQRYGKQLTQQAQRAALGKRPLDCWTDVAAELGLSETVSAEQLVAETEPLLAARCVLMLGPDRARLQAACVCS